MDKVYTYIHTPPPEYYSAIKNNEIMPVVATWVDLKIIILKVGQRHISYDITYYKRLIYKTDTESQT